VGREKHRVSQCRSNLSNLSNQKLEKEKGKGLLFLLPSFVWLVTPLATAHDFARQGGQIGLAGRKPAAQGRSSGQGRRGSGREAAAR
jgi:hypothetical protein